jgi:hypothetical protein
MGNCWKHLFERNLFPSPMCKLCEPHIHVDKWPYLVSSCQRPIIHGLYIDWHNKALWDSWKFLLTHHNTRCKCSCQWFYFKWFSNKNHCAPLVPTMLLFLIKIMFLPCHITPRYPPIDGLLTHSHLLTNQTPSICIQFIKFLYCHYWFLKTATTWKLDKHNRLLNTIRLLGLSKHKLESQSPLNLDSHGRW